MLRSQNPDTPKDDTSVTEITRADADIRTERQVVKARREGAGRLGRAAEPREVTSGVASLAVQTPAVLPPLTGYALDHFDDWTTVPAGYRCDGIAVVNGAITLAGNGESTDSRTGIMVSPAISLKVPALAAPVENRVSLPEGSNVTVEISLSQDGKDWSPWAVLERYRPPDGKRVAPPIQMALSTEQIAAGDDRSTESLSLPPGPAIRYRMTLSASGTKAPSVADVRIWKREYQ